MIVLVLLFIAGAKCGPATENYKDQYCTDPRTMHKHAAYTEWADAYSCTRHRCQPGGRNLAIYTVGCKRVEAPESAIECEEVVEDTNMQFPFCCTRLRCLVVVRGEVWTRVLGQPWESLPAAPWSHMYKMKKPPPGDGTFAPKVAEQGPVYELTDGESDAPHDAPVLRASKSPTTESPADCNDPAPRAAAPPPPDIVIALSTNSDPKIKSLEMGMTNSASRHKRVQVTVPRANDFFEDERVETDAEDSPPSTTEKSHYQTWTEIPQNQWNEHEAATGLDTDGIRDNPETQQDFDIKSDTEKPSNLQALVDAIGSRMRDIENVVQRMSEKVHPPDDVEKNISEDDSHKPQKQVDTKEYGKTKRPNLDDNYKRFSVRNRGSKYLHSSDSTTDKPLFIEDSNMNGYYSDASNSVIRRANSPKVPTEPVQTYMAPVETRRKIEQTDAPDDKKRKKHQHKKKKGKHHKKHRSKKKFNKMSGEMDKNTVSFEDSSGAGL